MTPESFRSDSGPRDARADLGIKGARDQGIGDLASLVTNNQTPTRSSHLRFVPREATS